MEKRRTPYSGPMRRTRNNRSSGSSSGRPSYRGGNNGIYNKRRRSGGRSRNSQPNFDIGLFVRKASTIVQEVETFVPENSFNDFAIDSRIKKVLESRNYKSPTPIQDKSIPHILNGEDIVGLANTGTGKTAAFLIPLIDKVAKNKGEQVLILAPTRELALQIESEFLFFAHALNLFSTACVGGAPIFNQIRRLSRPNHFIIGTPGRIIDLIKRGKLDITKTRSVVLDEADRMLDMGFIDDIRIIINKTPKERHTLCFSATMPPEIEKLINDFLISPTVISVKKQDIPSNINQDVVHVKGQNKTDVLANYLKNPDFKKVLVFGRTKHGVESLSQDLNGRGFRTESIHGDKSHPQRQRALKKFKEGFTNTLIATDVAARGLDISGITHVINFDAPKTYDDYVHRIGRTGRGVNIGNALTFLG